MSKRKVNITEQLDDQLIQFLEGTVGVCDANQYEMLMLWSDWHLQRNMSWVQHSGLLVTIGHYHKRPVRISMVPVDVEGNRIMFIEATSQLVDHAMINAWLDKHMPDTTRVTCGNSKCLNRVNAMNFFNGLPR